MIEHTVGIPKSNESLTVANCCFSALSTFDDFSLQENHFEFRMSYK